MNNGLSYLIVCLAVFSVRTIAQGVPSPQSITPEAQVRLGNECLAQKDYSMAMTWFRKAADLGNAVAQNNIGWLYENGFGVGQDYAEAMSWFLKAANQRYAEAQNNIGWLYKNGWGIRQDYSEAMTWFRKAADGGNPRAQQNIGVLYQNGRGVKQDYAEAMSWFRKAADQGNTDAQVNIGWLYQNGWGVSQDSSEAVKWYLGAANKGNAYAQNDLGWLYEKGLGVDQDYAVAMAWYYRAADQGHASAQNNLGLLYRNGLGEKQDYAKAMSWFHKAADQGDAKAQMNVGWLYEHGLGVHQDCAEAATWYRKAADQGYAASQTNLGVLYQNGCGFKQDYGEAMSWFRKAAEQNDAMAQNNVGWFYQNGFGVERDYSEAMTWYRKAADQGNALAKANLKNLRDEQTTGTTESNVPTQVTSEKASSPRVLMPGGIVAPRAVSAPDPEYSDEALKTHLEGTAVLKLTVDPEGKPRDIKVFVPLGSGLDEKAVDAVKTWRFEPATKDGKPVAVQIYIEVQFHVYGPSLVGKVEVIANPQGVDFVSYLSPLVVEAGKCWEKSVDDKTHPPSIKHGQVIVQFAVEKDGRADATEIAVSSGDEALDRNARECISTLKIGALFPAAFGEKELLVRMQLLYNLGGMSINPLTPRIAAGSKEQFYVEMAGAMSKSANWSVNGANCSGVACGTISDDGLYTAPDILPDPPYVRVKATLAGANPIAASAVLTLMGKH